ncbi:MAG: hypothetical protein Q7T55_17070, partial [Solirubrobacteraceae bacterium]|nr:hypothetical protein [Solirubrobacteraceae bacterium]
VDAQGMTRGQASAVLLVAVVVSGIAALLMGAAARRDPSSRHRITMNVSLASIAALAVLTFTPSSVIPAAVSVLCIAVIASGMGAGMLGFDLARRPDDHKDGASTSALVNLGGFSAAIAGMALVGAARVVLGPDTGLVLLPTLLIAAFGAWRLSQRPGWQRRTRGLSKVAGERATH